MENTLHFTDCTIYLQGDFIGNIHRIDVRDVTIEEGQRYAQYSDAVKVTWLAKGKRKRSGTWLTYRPFLVVLSRKEAIEPDPMYLPATTDERGTSVAASRYTSHDDRWVTDFTAKLVGTTPLYQKVG